MAQETKAREHESSLPGFLGTIDSLISRFESFALAAGVLLMAVNTVANVVGRFIFQHSIFFTEELNRILIILITFAGIGYAALWNAFKRIAEGASAAEKAALFSGTARRVYRLD